GVAIARRHGIAGDAACRTLLRQCFGEAVDAGFGGRVVDLSVLPGLAVDRADVDDPAEPARAHAVDHRPRHVEARGQVGLDHRVPLLEAHPVHRRVTGDAGVVDQDLDRPERALDRLYALGAGAE